MSSTQAGALNEVKSVAPINRSKLSFALGDVVFKFTALFFALVVLMLLAGIIVMLVKGSLPAFEAFGPGFITSDEWDPVRELYGAWPSLTGTLVAALIAMLIGLPLSFGIAVFITEMAPQWLKRPVGTAVELLAAVPSIIYGMWGLFFFAPFFAAYIQPGLVAALGPLPIFGTLFQMPVMGGSSGVSVLTAGIVLAIMIVPFMASVIRDVFEIVPGSLKESAYAMGATTWEVVWNVVLPFTKTGVVGGIMLGLGRAIGETMAVTFIIGNASQLGSSLLDPGTTIAAKLANEFNEADGLQMDSLIAMGLILFVITFIVLMLSKLMLMRLAATQEGSKT
ncbi:MAG: phosphate ABC transporter permease subunit PstC [Gammaproteobacteria bacterium 28-57-27]|nr:MAG: phosphate ABC transporter permease subunit PstC [Gammaproteobacteria bacterium 28-57-27]